MEGEVGFDRGFLASSGGLLLLEKREAVESLLGGESQGNGAPELL